VNGKAAAGLAMLRLLLFAPDVLVLLLEFNDDLLR